MRPTVDIWLEIIHKRLDAGESAVVAISKANLVTNAYITRFAGLDKTPGADYIPAEYFAQKEEQHETSLPIPTPDYIAGDPNAR